MQHGSTGIIAQYRLLVPLASAGAGALHATLKRPEPAPIGNEHPFAPGVQEGTNRPPWLLEEAFR